MDFSYWNTVQEYGVKFTDLGNLEQPAANFLSKGDSSAALGGNLFFLFYIVGGLNILKIKFLYPCVEDLCSIFNEKKQYFLKSLTYVFLMNADQFFFLIFTNFTNREVFGQLTYLFCDIMQYSVLFAITIIVLSDFKINGCMLYRDSILVFCVYTITMIYLITNIKYLLLIHIGFYFLFLILDWKNDFLTHLGLKVIGKISDDDSFDGEFTSEMKRIERKLEKFPEKRIADLRKMYDHIYSDRLKAFRISTLRLLKRQGEESSKAKLTEGDIMKKLSIRMKFAMAVYTAILHYYHDKLRAGRQTRERLISKLIEYMDNPNNPEGGWRDLKKGSTLRALSLMSDDKGAQDAEIHFDEEEISHHEESMGEDTDEDSFKDEDDFEGSIEQSDSDKSSKEEEEEKEDEKKKKHEAHNIHAPSAPKLHGNSGKGAFQFAGHNGIHSNSQGHHQLEGTAAAENRDHKHNKDASILTWPHGIVRQVVYVIFYPFFLIYRVTLPNIFSTPEIIKTVVCVIIVLAYFVLYAFLINQVELDLTFTFRIKPHNLSILNSIFYTLSYMIYTYEYVRDLKKASHNKEKEEHPQTPNSKEKAKMASHKDSQDGGVNFFLTVQEMTIFKYSLLYSINGLITVVTVDMVMNSKILTLLSISYIFVMGFTLISLLLNVSKLWFIKFLKYPIALLYLAAFAGFITINIYL